MQNIKIAIGSDHRGFNLKQNLLTQTTIANYKIDWLDFGTFSQERTDYPLFTWPVVNSINNQAKLGILICGSGIGMSIAANRYAGIYAGLVWNEEVAKAAKEDDNINILVIPADYIEQNKILDIISAWLTSEFKGGRYLERLKQIDKGQIDEK